MEATETRIESIEAEEVTSGASVLIERSPAEVFAVLTRVAGHTDWAKGPEEITDVSDDPAKLGTTWQQVGKALGRKFVAKLQVNAYEENRKFGFGSDKPFPMEFLFTLKPVAGGTEVRAAANGQLTNIFGKMALPILAKSLERQMEADLYSLKGLLENQS